MLNLRFYGAAQATTGSMHIMEFDGRRVILDCGLVQGKRKESFEMNRRFPFDPRSIDAVILSHAHIDHSGKIPALVRQGFKGPIYCTAATRDLCEVMLRDSAFLQERDVEFVNKRRRKQGKIPFELLYGQADVERAMSLFRALDYHEPREVLRGLTVTLYDTGHILGAAAPAFDYVRDGKPRRMLFSGDVGQRDTPLLKNPEPVANVDTLIIESTYGDRTHPTRENIKGRMKDYITFIYQHKSKMIVPAFSVGRTQQLLFLLNDLVENGRVPRVPVYVDSPLSRAATAITKKHPECFNGNMIKLMEKDDDPFDFPGLEFTESVQDSMALNEKNGPMVIISASGMCEGGRILHHLRNNIGNPLNIVLITGFQAENTLGRRIVENNPVIKIFGEEYDLKSTVFTINGLSGHADRRGLRDYASALGPKLSRVFCVHGEPEHCKANAENMREIGVSNVNIPVPGQLFKNV